MIFSAENDILVGFIEVKEEGSSREGSGKLSMMSFSVKRYGAASNNMVDCKTVSLDEGAMLLLGPLASKKWLATKFEGYQKISTFAAHLQNVIQDILERQGDDRSRAGRSYGATTLVNSDIDFSSSKGTIELMNQINNLGWHHIVSLDKSMTKVEMAVTEERGRRHKFDVNLGSNYPHSLPAVHAALPVPVHVSDSRLSSIVNAVQAAVNKYATLFDVLSDLDEHCWVLEPLKPTFATAQRRLVIDKACSVLLEIDPERPLALCEMRFLGPPDRVQRIQATVTANLHEWKVHSGDVSIRPGLEAVLGLRLPTRGRRHKRSRGDMAPEGKGKVGEGEEEEDFWVECGICYSFSGPDQREGEADVSTLAAPDQVCPRASCQRMYHHKCLLEWLYTVPSTRTSLGTVFGHCPYCAEWLSIKTVLK